MPGKEEQAENIAQLSAFATVVPTAILFLVVCHFLPKAYSDMFTSRRGSVSHRRFKPERNAPYKLVVLCTSACVVLFVISKALTTAWYLLRNNHPACPPIHIIAALTFQFGKLAMYTIFLIRLHLVFYGSLYAYSMKTLKGWAIFFQVYSLIVCVFMVMSSLSWKDHCLAEQTPPVLAVIGLIFIEDVGFSIGFLVAFVKPLKKFLRIINMETERRNVAERSEAEKHTGKFYYIAVKITILTAIATISTTISLLLYFATQIDLLGFDILINGVCVILMTPYYQDAKYYQRICCWCIQCCTPKTKRYLSKVRKNEMEKETTERSGTEKFAVSVDTADQVQHAAHNLAPTKKPPTMEVIKSGESEIHIEGDADAAADEAADEAADDGTRQVTFKDASAPESEIVYNK